MGKIIGIDLGTTNSVVAVMVGSEPFVIPSAEGERIIPSVVAVNKNDERLVGRVARNQSIINAQNTVFSVKRFMGSKFEDDLVQRSIKRVPYRVTPAENGDLRIWMGAKEYAPPEISAMILAKLKRDAEAYLGEPVTQAVITVPAYFNDAQRNATKDAGKIAGLEVLRIINEPTASSLAYGLDKKTNETILVYDLGGGTFDVSILEVGDGVFEVKATSGDTFLGGDDFDERIMEYLAGEFQRENGFDLRRDPQALQRLKEAAERAKIEMTSTLQADVHLPYITADASGPKHLSVSLTRSKLEQLTAELVERTLAPIRQALSDASLTPAQINEIVLVGGMTRMPAIQETVRRFFGKEPHKGVNPDEVVAIGAAVQAGVLAGDVANVLLLDVTPLTLSIETMGGVATTLIERNTTIPTRKVDVFSTATDNQPQVEVHVVQGERPLAADNKSLGRFILDGIYPAPRGMPQIEVTFDIDANGILKVTARDRSTGRTQHITLTASSGLSNEEVEKMRQDAEAHTVEDRKQRNLIEARNQADTMLQGAREILQASGNTLSGAKRFEVEKSFGLWFGAYAESLTDDMEMIIAAYNIADKNPLGSGAGYGSAFPLKRKLTTELLHFSDTNYNSVYAQMTRGKAEKATLTAFASVASTVSKFAYDVCLYMNQQFAFISFPDSLTTGSSIMPHKKNPDVFELLRAKCNRLQAAPNEMTLLCTNLPSGYHRDMQLTKDILFPAVDSMKECLSMLIYSLQDIRVRKDILNDAKFNDLFSVEEINKLVVSGVPFRDAYKMVGAQINEGKFNPDRKVAHTHEGSINNLCNAEIKSRMEELMKKMN